MRKEKGKKEREGEVGWIWWVVGKMEGKKGRKEEGKEEEKEGQERRRKVLVTKGFSRF